MLLPMAEVCFPFFRTLLRWPYRKRSAQFFGTEQAEGDFDVYLMEKGVSNPDVQRKPDHF